MNLWIRAWAVAVVGVAAALSASAQEDVNEANEKAMKAAALKAAPWTVKIETAGGQDVIGTGGATKGPVPKGPPQPGQGVRKGTGPTTGVIVDKDGYIISSAFNFANNPSDIFVSIPGKPRAVAKVVCTDTTRMLTLLKIDAKDLPVPTAVPKKDITVGQWSLALGRALDPDIADLPSVSAGIISALGRIHGKAIQCDAKVSPVNYGGPLVAIDGRVQGILVPAAPRGEGETAGVEWYDSGIGFAIPLEDIFAVLPRMKTQKELRRGRVGITPQSQEEYSTEVVVGTVAPASVAEQAGIKPGDKIVAVDGKKVRHFSDLQHLLGPKYEGDTVSITAVRDGKEQQFANLTLAGEVVAFAQPFLGILGMRDDDQLGLEIRYVYPDSPAAAAKLQPGDRILKAGPAAGRIMTPFTGRAQLAQILSRMSPGQELKMEVKRKDEKGDKLETVTAKLVAPTEAIPDKLPLPSSKEKAGMAKGPNPMPQPKEKDEPKKDEPEPETGLQKRTNEVLGREYWVYVPKNYQKTVSHGVIVWFHALGKGGKDADDMVDLWEDFCRDNHFILIGPKSKGKEGWVASETEEVLQDIKKVMDEYTTDKNRVIAHGMGNGGQMAFYLGFNARETFRGVAVTGAVMGAPPKDNVPNQPLQFFIVGGDKDPLIKEIVDTKAKLLDKKFPVVYRQLADFGKEYLDKKTFAELWAWMDSLDRI